MTVSVQYAQEHIADIFRAAIAGEEVVIARPGEPALRLVVDNSVEAEKSHAAESTNGRKPRILGAGRGEMRVPSVEEWAEMDRQIAAEMNDRPLSAAPSR